MTQTNPSVDRLQTQRAEAARDRPGRRMDWALGVGRPLPVCRVDKEQGPAVWQRGPVSQLPGMSVMERNTEQ